MAPVVSVLSGKSVIGWLSTPNRQWVARDRRARGGRILPDTPTAIDGLPTARWELMPTYRVTSAETTSCVLLCKARLPKKSVVCSENSCWQTAFARKNARLLCLHKIRQTARMTAYRTGIVLIVLLFTVSAAIAA
jgi:hypothetical protein